jgi:hypothetical protein
MDFIALPKGFSPGVGGVFLAPATKLTSYVVEDARRTFQAANDFPESQNANRDSARSGRPLRDSGEPGTRRRRRRFEAISRRGKKFQPIRRVAIRGRFGGESVLQEPIFRKPAADSGSPQDPGFPPSFHPGGAAAPAEPAIS